jgi:hypothetical protein
MKKNLKISFWIFDMLHRVNSADLARFESLLIKRLCHTYEGRTWPEIKSYLLTALQSNEFYFVAFKDAIGCFQKLKVRLQVKPIVDEIFCIGLNVEAKKDVIEIYKAAWQWGKNIGASEMTLDACSDLNKPEFKSIFPNSGAYTMPYAEIS